MSEIRIQPHELGDRLKQSGKEIQEAQLRASFSAAMRLKTYLVKRTDEVGAVDMGTYKNSHHAEPTNTGAIVYNDAPHSGIVEQGARPHFISRDGMLALQRWCVRRLHLSEKEAWGAAWAIAHNIAEKGQQGRWIYRDSQDQAREFYHLEIQRELKEMDL